MIVLGIDPGFGRCGYGCVKITVGRLEHITHGCIETPTSATHEIRLGLIYDELTQVIHTFRPEACAVEKIFFSQSTTTALRVAESRGVVLLAAERAHIPVREFTPLEVKQALTGFGRAEKRQVAFMVQNLLALPSLPKEDDAVDALAVAITAIHMRVIHS